MSSPLRLTDLPSEVRDLLAEPSLYPDLKPLQNLLLVRKDLLSDAAKVHVTKLLTEYRHDRLLWSLVAMKEDMIVQMASAFISLPLSQRRETRVSMI